MWFFERENAARRNDDRNDNQRFTSAQKSKSDSVAQDSEQGSMMEPAVGSQENKFNWIEVYPY